MPLFVSLEVKPKVNTGKQGGFKSIGLIKMDRLSQLSFLPTCRRIAPRENNKSIGLSQKDQLSQLSFPKCRKIAPRSDGGNNNNQLVPLRSCWFLLQWMVWTDSKRG